MLTHEGQHELCLIVCMLAATLGCSCIGQGQQVHSMQDKTSKGWVGVGVCAHVCVRTIDSDCDGG